MTNPSDEQYEALANVAETKNGYLITEWLRTNMEATVNELIDRASDVKAGQAQVLRDIMNAFTKAALMVDTARVRKEKDASHAGSPAGTFG